MHSCLRLCWHACWCWCCCCQLGTQNALPPVWVVCCCFACKGVLQTRGWLGRFRLQDHSSGLGWDCAAVMGLTSAHRCLTLDGYRNLLISVLLPLQGEPTKYTWASALGPVSEQQQYMSAAAGKGGSCCCDRQTGRRSPTLLGCSRFTLYALLPDAAVCMDASAAAAA
jgi:hypothetical protein